MTIQGVAFSVFRENNQVFSSSMLDLSGDGKDIQKFFADLKKDKEVVKLEVKGSTCLLIEKAKSRAVQFYNPKLIFIKPILMDNQGFEYWEVASWDKPVVSDFIRKVQSHIEDFKLIRFHQTSIDNVFFPKLMPKLTDKQKQAMELAISEGYYQTPRKTDLRKLAKLMKLSLATYQQHLRAAEQKLIPNLLSYTE